MAPNPGPPTPAVPAPDLYRVKLSSGEEMRAAFVEPWWGSYVRVIDGAGKVRFIRANKLLAVVDTTGLDVVHRLVRDRRPVGTQPAVASSCHEPSKPKSPLTGFISHSGVFFRAGHFDETKSAPMFLQVDFGGVGRVSNRYGLGASLFLSGDDKVTSFGLKARGRRLLRQDLVLDVAPGIVLDTRDDYQSRNSIRGFLVEADLIYNRWFSLAGQIEARNRTYYTGVYNAYSDVTEWGYYFGVKLGSVPGGALMLPTALAIGIVHPEVNYEAGPPSF